MMCNFCKRDFPDDVVDKKLGKYFECLIDKNLEAIRGRYYRI